MNDYKLNKCIQDIQNEIWLDSNEGKMFKLGFAAGANHILGALQEYLKEYVVSSVFEGFADVLKSDECMCGEYFKKIYEASNAPNTREDNYRQAYEWSKNKN